MACADPKTIGQGRQYADPEDAERATHGVYTDLVRAVPPEGKMPTRQQAGGPQPFGMLRHANGGAG